MHTRPRPDWILIANATRARVLQHEAGSAMVILESFVHPAGRGQPSDPAADAGQQECARFANELGRFLEQEARLAHFQRLTIFAGPAFIEVLKAGLGQATTSLLSAVHELDLTAVGVAELERRVLRELALAAH